MAQAVHTQDSVLQAIFATRLLATKAVHTVVWAFFAGCILCIPIFAWFVRFQIAVWLIAVTAVEVLVILFSGGRCPLTGVAARYTGDRRARNSQRIFGTLYACGALLNAPLCSARGP